jgi:hypothetical protein
MKAESATSAWPVAPMPSSAAARREESLQVSPVNVRNPAVLPAARVTLVAPMFRFRCREDRRRAGARATPGRNRSGDEGDDDQDEQRHWSELERAVATGRHVLGSARRGAAADRGSDHPTHEREPDPPRREGESG